VILRTNKKSVGKMGSVGSGTGCGRLENAQTEFSVFI
jgi:hypothetical protein